MNAFNSPGVTPAESANWEPQRLADLAGGVFLSDLHLFSPRSVAQDVQLQLRAYDRPAQCVVLGGDIFDFRWSTHASLQATLLAAQCWLIDLLENLVHAHVLFLPGNHDCQPEFLESLNVLSDRFPRFGWKPHHWQLGCNLFLHGDILDAGGDLPSLDRYRRRFHHGRAASKLAQRCYDVAVACRIHKTVPRLRHVPNKTCRALLNVVDRLALANAAELRHIYFGHTHVAMEGLNAAGIQFHNPGSGLKHMQLRLVEFTNLRDK
ncbi:MAG: metallophosphoesterase [Planctomycetales bacterium]|nr:metallophosphoesterase [Planctomycetales bacterium]